MVARVERVTARILAVVAAFTGLLLTWRAWCGPFQLGPLWIRSPFTLETVFALSVGGLLVIACGHRRATAASTLPRWTRLPLLLLALVLTALTFAPNLRDPFLSDDYILTTNATLVPAVLGRTFVTPGGDGAFRPLGHVWFGLIHSFAGTNPLPWHCCSLVMHLLNCALLFMLAGALGKPAALVHLGTPIRNARRTGGSRSVDPRPISICWPVHFRSSRRYVS
jgi:hypothetical protein